MSLTGDFAYFFKGVSDFGIDEVKVNLLPNLSQKMCPGNPLFKVHMMTKDLRLNSG
jgi:hypothetical protein